jgi:2-polyprenyl-3-methyl-5-hydroxy-6-metoxy-1,4-benzoquinol methylase
MTIKTEKSAIEILNRENGVTTLSYNNTQIKTKYSPKVISMLVDRKGKKRAIGYLSHKERSIEFLKPLFQYLNQHKENLRVLEVGCSAGQVTEYLQEQPCILKIVSYDVDKEFIEIAKLKQKELNLNKVSQVDHLTSDQTLSLPYEKNSFDLIIVLAVVEHLPYEGRYKYVDQYYNLLKVDGIIGFWDTPNRYFPIERHSIGLPFIAKMTPQNAYIYARIMGKLTDVSFPEFVRPGGGWRNSSYYELLPHSNMIDVKDISELTGYKKKNLILRFLCWIFKCPQGFFMKNLDVVFKKVHSYE